MKPLTIKEMHALLDKVIKQHPEYTDNILMVSDDEEGNGFHALYEASLCLYGTYSYYNHQTNQREETPALAIL